MVLKLKNIIARVKLLDLKNDLVFKMFFANEKHKRILIRFLTTVLKPQSEIVDVKLLNPNITQAEIQEGQAILDVLVELASGEKVDVEMQVRCHDSFRERCLFYWARLHGRQLKRGDVRYSNLRPTHSIIITNFAVFSDPEYAKQYHTRVHTAAEGSTKPFTDHLKMHFIELPKIAKMERSAAMKDPVARWGLLMLEPTYEMLDKLSQCESIFEEVKEAMSQMSASQRAQHRADMREKGRADQEQRELDSFKRGSQEALRMAAVGLIETGISRELVCKALSITESELSAILATAAATGAPPKES